MLETRAAVAHPGAGAFTWESVRLEDPRPDEVLVRVVGVGICHTDLASRDEQLHTPLPAVLGHEGAGVVEAAGELVTGVTIGDTVLLSFDSCGSCVACLHGHPAYCRSFTPRNFDAARPDGTTPIRSREDSPIGGRFFGQSSFAEHCVAHERGVVPVRVDDEDELALLAPIGCGVQTGAGAVLNELSVRPGDSVAVFGVGGVGLSAVMAAALTTATRIVAVDIVDSRLEFAKEVGATDVINGAEEDVAARLEETTGGRGVDHALESSGLPALLRQAVDALSVGGTVAVVGAPPAGTDASFDVNFLLNGRGIRGVTEGDSDLTTFVPSLVELYRSGRLPFDRMIRTYPPERINEAAADTVSGEVLKPVLRFPS